MLDIGWSEMAVIVLIALIVIGPKELPQAMRAASKWVRKARSLARDFQSGVDDMIREAELEDARKAIQSTKSFDVDKAFEETVDPGGEIGTDAKDLERTARSGDTEPTQTADASGTGKDTPPDEAVAEKAAAEEGATLIEHPLKVAPAHSVAPPAEDSAPAEAEAEGTSKRA